MPQPTPGQLHIDTYLTNVAQVFTQDAKNFISDKVFPTVPVLKASDKFAIYPKGYFFRDEVEVRPLGGRPPQAGYEVQSGTYVCEEFGLEDKIDDRVRDNADMPLDPDLASMRLLEGQMQIHRDSLWADSYFVADVWGTNQTGVDSDPVAGTSFLAFDQAGSTPVEFFDSERFAIGSGTGFMPNTLVLGTGVYVALKSNADILDRIKFTQRGIVTPEILAALFDVDQVLIPTGVVNTAKEGQADDIGFILSPNSAMLCYAAPAPSITSPSAGYTFAWTGLIPGVTNAYGGVIERGREELNHSDVIQARASYTQEIVAPELGAFYTDCVDA